MYKRQDYEPLTEEENKYARNPLTHVDFLLFNQIDKQPMLAIEVDGTGFHEAGSKQAERDIKKNSILEKCAVPLLRLRTDGSGRASIPSVRQRPIRACAPLSCRTAWLTFYGDEKRLPSVNESFLTQ